MAEQRAQIPMFVNVYQCFEDWRRHIPSHGSGGDFPAVLRGDARLSILETMLRTSLWSYMASMRVSQRETDGCAMGLG